MEELREEIEKWTKRVHEKRKSISVVRDEARGQLSLADDYVSDSSHFLAQNRLIESFEALVYAWAIIETLERLGLVGGKR